MRQGLLKHGSTYLIKYEQFTCGCLRRLRITCAIAGAQPLEGGGLDSSTSQTCCGPLYRPACFQARASINLFEASTAPCVVILRRCGPQILPGEETRSVYAGCRGITAGREFLRRPERRVEQHHPIAEQDFRHPYYQRQRLDRCGESAISIHQTQSE